MFKSPLVFCIFFSLHWNTSFPAVTVCEIFNGEKNWDLNDRYVIDLMYGMRYISLVPLVINFMNRYFGKQRNNKLDDFVSDIAFFNGKCYACNLCDNDFVCPVNLSDIVTKVSFI